MQLAKVCLSFHLIIVKKDVRLNSLPATLGVQLGAIQNDELWQEGTTMFC